MEGLIQSGRRYFNVQNGVMIERVNGSERAINYLSHVRLMKAEIKVIYKGPESARERVGEQLHLHLISQDQYYVLCMWLNSRYAKAFYSIMESISFQSEIVLITEMKFEDDGRKREGLYIKQNGSFLKWNYTKNSPNGLPPLMKGADGKWDDSQQMSFFRGKIETWLIPKLEMVTNPFPNHPSYSGNVGNKLVGNHFGVYEKKAYISKQDGSEQSGTSEYIVDEPDDLPF